MGIWQADGSATFSQERERNRNAPGLRNENMFKTAQGTATHFLHRGSEGLFYWFEGYLPELTWFCNCSVRFTWPYPDTSIEAFLKLGVANSSKTLVSGSCLFSSHLQILQSLLDWKKWILSIFHYKHYIMPWERIQQQTRQCSRGRQGPVKCPARLWHLLIAWIHE